MYRLLKESGAGKTVRLENESTSAVLNIGGVSTTMIDMLVRDGKDIDITTDRTFITQEWNFTVSDDCAKDLSKLAFTMRKPIRDQRKVVIQNQQPKSNKEIDAMDVLLGLANYN